MSIDLDEEAVSLDAIRQDIADATGYQMRDGKAWAQCSTAAGWQSAQLTQQEDRT